MKFIIISLLLSFSLTSLAAKDTCDVKKLPKYEKKVFKELAIKKVSKKKTLNNYLKYDVQTYSSKVIDGKKNIASVEFFYKNSKPFRINFFVDCTYGDYIIKDDF
ncbi:MAG: hypothetical protein ACRBBP_11770 [Bdellovibrionales bacterium]